MLGVQKRNLASEVSRTDGRTNGLEARKEGSNLEFWQEAGSDGRGNHSRTAMFSYSRHSSHLFFSIEAFGTAFMGFRERECVCSLVLLLDVNLMGRDRIESHFELRSTTSPFCEELKGGLAMPTQ